MGTGEEPRVGPESRLGQHCNLVFMSFCSMGVWQERTGLMLCFANVHGWPP